MRNSSIKHDQLNPSNSEGVLREYNEEDELDQSRLHVSNGNIANPFVLLLYANKKTAIHKKNNTQTLNGMYPENVRLA
jgi:hypothetical protein